ncbi:spx/MgsR family transcriptional regulator [Enterococcus faecalis EnGen0078]|nr:spx/MgsR family transcriptional regulator [Enterococcus faecalis EnGen0078]EOK34592.1 spx/MgsR family transcriptional regulator [Enterococcus faecalis EnGen0334]
MLTIYTTRIQCMSSKKAITWFTEKHIPYKVRRINRRSPLTKEEIKVFLLRTDNGFEDLYRKQSKLYAKIDKIENLEECSIERAMELICEYPLLIKETILLSEDKIAFGFTENIGRRFIPKEQRKWERLKLYSQLDF